MTGSVWDPSHVKQNDRMIRVGKDPKITWFQSFTLRETCREWSTGGQAQAKTEWECLCLSFGLWDASLQECAEGLHSFSHLLINAERNRTNDRHRGFQSSVLCRSDFIPVDILHIYCSKQDCHLPQPCDSTTLFGNLTQVLWDRQGTTAPEHTSTLRDRTMCVTELAHTLALPTNLLVWCSLWRANRRWKHIKETLDNSKSPDMRDLPMILKKKKKKGNLGMEMLGAGDRVWFSI